MLLLELEADPKASQGQLKGWYGRYAKDADFTAVLVSAITSSNETLQHHGSWLLKHHMEKKGALTPQQWNAIASHLVNLTQWGVLLHLCQCMTHTPALDEQSISLLADFLRRCANHKKPFVRAWAITGMHELAKQFPQLRAEAEVLVRTAVNDPAKSVQARLRQLQ